jgi:hypothetical protein
MTESPRVWQYDLIAEALAAGTIDELQALLLGMLYFHANWSTRKLTDFRAERACEWLGHDLNYTRSMQKRLSALREKGWFTWTYVKGIKVPYDITMRPQYAGECAPPSSGDRHGETVIDDDRPAVTVTVSEGVDGLPVPDVLNLTPRVLGEETQASLGDGGAHISSLARKLHARVYKVTDGIQIAQMLTPAQTETLLSQRSEEEIIYAIVQRQSKVTDKREFRRTFRTFLLDGGVQIELDAAREKLQESLDNVSRPFRPFERVTKANTIRWVDTGKYLKVGEFYNRKETTEERAERQHEWITEHADDLRIFPAIEFQAATMYAETVRQQLPEPAKPAAVSSVPEPIHILTQEERDEAVRRAVEAVTQRK